MAEQTRKVTLVSDVSQEDQSYDRALRTHEVEVKERELELKPKELSRNRWTNAAIVAVLGLVGGGLSNLGIGAYKALRADESLSTKASFDQTLEG
jgi:hypothetical protein